MDMFILILKGIWILGVSVFFIFWLWNYALWFLSSDRHGQQVARTLKAERERIRKEERERIQKEL